MHISQRLSWATVFAAGAIRAACDGPGDAAIKACEVFVKERLRSPSTYQRIEASSFIEVGGEHGWASIQYDAANAYGTPIRNQQTCRFATPGGRWPSYQDMAHRARLMAIGDRTGICCVDEDLDASAEQLLRDAENVINAAMDVSLESDPAPRDSEDIHGDVADYDPPQGDMHFTPEEMLSADTRQGTTSSASDANGNATAE